MIRFHDLRHTAVSLMVNNGIPAIFFEKIIGNSRPNTTLEIYSHLAPSMQDGAARMMDELTALHEVDLSAKVEEKKVGEGENISYSHQFTPEIYRRIDRNSLMSLSMGGIQSILPIICGAPGGTRTPNLLMRGFVLPHLNFRNLPGLILRES